MPRNIKTEEVKQARKQRQGQTYNLLKQILNDMSEIKQEITKIDKRITTIEKVTQDLKNDVNLLKKRVFQ
jgi:archaellum component FlaC